jgi:hypothetical protein
MTDQHPITPPPELVQQWREAPEFFELSPCALVTVTTTKLQDIATQSAQWGADQELEACCEWLILNGYGSATSRLRDARRPKPPSLKEQALEIVRGTPVNSAGLYSYEHVEIIRRALEQLDD